jgi:hypothetical protein
MVHVSTKWLLAAIFSLMVALWTVLHFSSTSSESKLAEKNSKHFSSQAPSTAYKSAYTLGENILVSGLESIFSSSPALQVESSSVQETLQGYPKQNLLHLVNGKSINTVQDSVQPNIAYVFAGSARSFICPKVHWSIKSHLIDALGGNPHVFIRLSLEDNVNVKTGHGVLEKLDYGEVDVMRIVSILNPRKVDFFSFSNQTIDMERDFPSPIHTVFRENDQRRYSMFYHRCKAYQMVLEYEQQHRMKFDWVVLVRLDAAWVEPILPIQAYDSDRVWITETGYELFNDQFMLIPRQFSDYLYDLDTKVRQGVYCLGGPDVERWKCDPEQLRQKGVSEEKIQAVLPYCCPDNKVGRDNIMGMSEAIHLRHLREGVVPVSLGRFPVFLTRRYRIRNQWKCQPECFRIYALHYKEYVFLVGGGKQSAVYPYLTSGAAWPDTRSVGKLSMCSCVVVDATSNNCFLWR